MRLNTFQRSQQDGFCEKIKNKKRKRYIPSSVREEGENIPKEKQDDPKMCSQCIEEAPYPSSLGGVYQPGPAKKTKNIFVILRWSGLKTKTKKNLVFSENGDLPFFS